MDGSRPSKPGSWCEQSGAHGRSPERESLRFRDSSVKVGARSAGGEGWVGASRLGYGGTWSSLCAERLGSRALLAHVHDPPPRPCTSGSSPLTRSPPTASRPGAACPRPRAGLSEPRRNYPHPVLLPRVELLVHTHTSRPVLEDRGVPRQWEEGSGEVAVLRGAAAHPKRSGPPDAVYLDGLLGPEYPRQVSTWDDVADHPAVRYCSYPMLPRKLSTRCLSSLAAPSS